MTFLRRLSGPRAALVLSLGIMWLNYALTTRWAHVPGSVHGPKEWVFVPLLALTSALALGRWPPARRPLGLAARVLGLAALATLAALFPVWFPPETWTQIPYLDNWPARYQSTMDGIALLKRGAFAGWQWHYLGGYHLSSDITQSHALLAFVPVLAFGPAVGFHLLHAVLFLAVPVLVFLDLREEDQETRWLATGLAAVLTCGFSYFLLRSGDTNSLAGLVCLALALVASHAAARGVRGAGAGLVAAVALLNYVHAGFVLYTALVLAVEAVFYRDGARLRRAIVAMAFGTMAGLPVHWESWRYPEYFIANNVILDPDAKLQWLPLLRQIYYNVELLWLPGRWFNDFTGLAALSLPITVYVAWRVRSRAGLYAWIALAAMALLRLNTGQFAYLFLRPIHLLVLCMGPVLAVFVSRFVPSRPLAVSVVLLVGVYLQVLVFHVPHVRAVSEAEPVLTDRLARLDGALVLVENTPHRDMDTHPRRATEPPPFGAHLEQGLAAATGKRLYAGFWDGWQWSPYRDQVLAGGAFKGRLITEVPLEMFTRELRKWGVRHLLVWSGASTSYLRGHPGHFVERWSSGRWHQFEYLAADPRTAAAEQGAAAIAAFDPLGARVDLRDVHAGARVVLRTNYHPSWTARLDSTAERIVLSDVKGQLGFTAPRDGSYSVSLVYPRRPWTVLLAAGAVLVGCVVGARTGDRREDAGTD